MEQESNEGKLKSLENSIANIEKAFGKGAIMKLGARPSINVNVISSGSLLLDAALGVGGFPKGRIIEIYGPESSGKTTLALHAIAEAQKSGGIAAFIDAEHALDPNYAKVLGVNINELYISQPDTGEQALEIIEYLARSGAVDIIVLDSVAALTPKAEIEGEMGDSHMGLQARLMSQALRKLTAAVSKSNCCIVFINQLRQKIGIAYGNPETTTGGIALKFYASMRLDIRKSEMISGGTGTEPMGNKIRVKIVKNKLSPPFREVELEMTYGVGISREGSILDAGVKYNLIQKSGSWFSYGDKKIGQGRESAKVFLSENPDVAKFIEDKIRSVFILNSNDKESKKETKHKKDQDKEQNKEDQKDLL